MLDIFLRLTLDFLLDRQADPLYADQDLKSGNYREDITLA